MIKLLWAFMIMVALAIPLHAELTYEGAYNPNQNLQEYFDEAYPNYDKPIIYVFFNNDPCFQCPQTIELIEQVYNRNYQNKYSLFLINYQNDDEYNFIETYDLNSRWRLFWSTSPTDRASATRNWRIFKTRFPIRSVFRKTSNIR